ncbi:MAG: DivIVA domain-containing protein [Acidimicrobiales bacterium]
MDSTDNATSALDSIDTVAFTISLRGYKVDEVDDFLERLSVEVRQLKDLAAQQRQQLRQAAERISQLDAREGAPASAPATSPAPAPAPAPSAPAPAPSPSIRTGGAAGAEQVTTMIAMAQRFIDEAQGEAEEKAREFTAAAQDRAREIVNEARSRAEDEVNRLNGMKQRLSEDVETLAQQLNAERTRIAQVLAEFTAWVETSLQADTRATTPPRPTSAARPAPAPLPTPAPAPSSGAPRPSDVPPPAPAPSTNAGEATMAQPTIGQVLKFDRDDR